MIRKAASADLERVLELIRAYYRFDDIDYDEAKVRPATERLLQDESIGNTFLAELGGQVVGYAQATWGYDVEFGGRFLLLTDLFVEEKHRGAGLGRALLAAVEEMGREKGAHAIEGQVIRGNERARGFYHKWGFRFPDRLLMSRRLD